MKGSNRTHLIRLVDWLGALADAAATVAMLLPAEMLSVPQSHVTPATRSAFAAGASLMLGWTCLLIWASAEPMARRAILLMTMIPVIPGLAASIIYVNRHGSMPLASAALMWCAQAVIFLLMRVAYSVAGRKAAASQASSR